MNHLGPEKTLTRFTQHSYSRANRIRIHLTAVKIKKAYPQHTAAVIHATHQLPPGAIRDFIVDDNAFNLYCLVFRNVADRIKMGFILVTQWQMQHQIEFIGDT
jgi:hypothetical protein